MATGGPLELRREEEIPLVLGAAPLALLEQADEEDGQDLQEHGGVHWESGCRSVPIPPPKNVEKAQILLQHNPEPASVALQVYPSG